jgi:hypothetical protein
MTLKLSDLLVAVLAAEPFDLKSVTRVSHSKLKGPSLSVRTSTGPLSNHQEVQTIRSRLQPRKSAVEGLQEESPNVGTNLPAHEADTCRVVKIAFVSMYHSNYHSRRRVAGRVLLGLMLIGAVGKHRAWDVDGLETQGRYVKLTIALTPTLQTRGGVNARATNSGGVNGSFARNHSCVFPERSRQP